MTETYTTANQFARLCAGKAGILEITHPEIVGRLHAELEGNHVVVWDETGGTKKWTSFSYYGDRQSDRIDYAKKFKISRAIGWKRFIKACLEFHHHRAVESVLEA